jgi:hypothetical protein
MDIGEKIAVAPSEVRAKGPLGSIRSNTVRLSQGSEGDGSTTIVFEGAVHLLIRPKN